MIDGLHHQPLGAVLKLILAGDLHIGRTSSKLPGGAEPAGFRAAGAWERIVELAIAEGAGAVCLSGDVVDESNKFWEAISALERGIARLGDAGIRTLAVAGNHDFDVLARLADELPRDRFHLIGRGGVWERVTLQDGGRAVLHIDGWSFPQRSVDRDPAESYAGASADGVPVMGMVHGDLDDPQSRYGPLSAERLRAAPVFGWLLGHIHAPRLIEERPWFLYPGSAQSLDPGEPGAHGAWAVEIKDGAMTLPELRPVSSIVYRTLEVDVTGGESKGDFESALLGALRNLAEDVRGGGGGNAEICSARVRVVGSTSALDSLDAVCAELRSEGMLELEAGRVAIDSISVAVTPLIDLGEIAADHTPPGALARLLIALEQPDGDDKQAPGLSHLLAEVRRRLAEHESSRQFLRLPRTEPSDEAVRETLAREAHSLMSALLCSREK